MGTNSKHSGSIGVRQLFRAAPCAPPRPRGGSGPAAPTGSAALGAAGTLGRLSAMGTRLVCTKPPARQALPPATAAPPRGAERDKGPRTVPACRGSHPQITELPESRAPIRSYRAPGAAAVWPRRGRVGRLSRRELPAGLGLSEPLPGCLRATAQLRRSHRHRQHRRSTSPAT